MSLLSAIFSHLCNQGRCFLIDGTPLPVCQRCLGLYTGAALTCLWLFASGLFRRGMPGPWPLRFHGLALLAAMLGGLHLLDFSPAWRMLCGLWTGHVAVVWLVCGGTALATGGRRWSPAANRQALATMAAAGMPALIIALWPVGWFLWTTAALAGLVALPLSVAWALGGMAIAYYRGYGRRVSAKRG